MLLGQRSGSAWAVWTGKHKHSTFQSWRQLLWAATGLLDCLAQQICKKILNFLCKNNMTYIVLKSGTLLCFTCEIMICNPWIEEFFFINLFLCHLQNLQHRQHVQKVPGTPARLFLSIFLIWAFVAQGFEVWPYALHSPGLLFHLESS